MFYKGNKNIIETDDIEEIKEGFVTIENDGTKLFHAVFKLIDDAVVDAPSLFHVTNGVNARLLAIVPPDVSEASDVKGKPKIPK